MSSTFCMGWKRNGDLIKFASVFAVDKKGVEFSNALCYNTHTTQDSYIGNTTASQAVKAGSTPVSCSKRKSTPPGCFSFLCGGEGSRTDLNADVRWTSACCQLDGGNSLIFTKGENVIKSRLVNIYSAGCTQNKKDILLDVSFIFAMDGKGT